MAKEVSDLAKALYPFAPGSYIRQHAVGSPEAAEHNAEVCRSLSIDGSSPDIAKNKLLVGKDKAEMLEMLEAARNRWRQRR